MAARTAVADDSDRYRLPPFAASQASPFFFQAEDGIRDYKVTGVQTCALPIFQVRSLATARRLSTAQATDEVLTERVENTRRIADQLRVEYQKSRIAEAVEVGQVEIGRASGRERG